MAIITTDSKYDHEFSQEAGCIYKGERYIARDNGQVLRHAPIGKRPRPNDDKWTFGKPNSKKGYMEIASVSVHRIVATAFHGGPPTENHVVDHIDTNKRNNRKENLRWVTRLENILLNPITAKRIATVCGSVEVFLADPSKFRDKFPDPKYDWMDAVSEQEAQLSLKRLLAWAASDKHPSGGSLGDWILNRYNAAKQHILPSGGSDVIMSRTVGAAQRDWRVPTEFPCCPQEYVAGPLITYAEKLEAGAVFCRNDVYSSLVSESAIADDEQSIYVISASAQGSGAVKPWALAKITFENGLFVHTSFQSFFEQDGAKKAYCQLLGLEWSGGDCIDDSVDDYC